MRFDRCYGCMQELRGDTVCPHCGFDASRYMEAEYALRPGTILQGRYTIGKVLGKGGFGITYIGFDMTLDIRVAVKEYYPEGFVGRDAKQSSRLTWYNTRTEIQYVKNSRDNLVKEARNMAKIDTFPTLARIRDVFMSNETAYLVMDYIEGITLKEMVMENGRLTYEKLCRYLCPVMEDLSKIHERGIIHRDISPDNIMVETNGGVRLLDLGAAKDLYQAGKTQVYYSEETQKEDIRKIQTGAERSTSEATQNSWQDENVPQSTQMVLKNGFSPLEQYRTRGELGPWTDVYAMTATMYYLLSGKVLPTPMDRLASEEEEKAVQNVINGLDIPEKTKEGMKKGLAILKKDRIGSMSELLEYCSIVDPQPKPRPKWSALLLGAAIIAGGGYAALSGFHPNKSAAQYYEEGNYEEALAAYRKDGDTENVKHVLQAAYEQAENYDKGSNGYEKNEEEAIRYYKLVAESDGDIDEIFVNVSCHNLGLIMAYNATQEDDAEAASWLEKAVSKGDASAAFILGDMYADGKLGEPDYDKAIELYKQAANDGYALAMQRLGEIYETDQYGTGINLEEALKWYQLAAENDYDRAQECVERVQQALQNVSENS